ncbi:hypothetical protein GCM10023232_26840 [Sphingosinicella ginsenosidimutans]|uniref:Helix-turn-helix transcriptional regulator n=1 Tax=Allosphingosinicella ginsenosidimutans TaxID=1176539 RepID=A0A5C6TTF7_9SPHN|nr:hypothetical protein [Sphingosinicella ginsenosidimutans]TXC63704.1 hypothetical protein FRZ32_08555 [Sphingosinicella ginsenosidimutans]
MNIRDYLKRPGAMSLTDLATAAGISKGRLSQLGGSDGEQPDVPPALALRLERETGGLIDASMISTVIAEARKAAA